MGCYKMYIMICSSTCYKRVLHAAEVFCSTEQPFINLQDYFNLTRVTHTERSQVAYLEVMDAISDRKDTIFFWNRKSNILAVFLPACTICNWNVALHTRLTLGHISG